MDTLNALTIFREQVSKYVEFDEVEWDVFKSNLTFSKLKKKQHFAEFGEVCDDIGFIVSGSVRYYFIKDGEEITNYFSFENEFVSAYKSFLTRQPSVGYIQALEDTELISISYNDLQQMFGSSLLGHKTERFLRLVGEYYLICYDDRMVSFITKSPEERYLELLNTGQDILRRMPQHYIANFLGITPVSLSRIRRRVLEPVR